MCSLYVFFFKQKTAYEMRISDWSLDVCSFRSYWSPNRMVDVVTEPGCMMALGADLLPTGGKLQGSQSSISDGTNTRKMFAQMHYYISPVWAMLDMFTDLPCLENDGFDVAMINEVLPTWQSGTLGAIIQPEG